MTTGTRWLVGIVGAVLLLAGTWVTVSTASGTGAAALITVGSAIGLGAVLWSSVESISAGGFRVKVRAEQAEEALARGETELAEALSDEVLAELMPRTQAAREAVRRYERWAFSALQLRDREFGVLGASRAGQGHDSDIRVTSRSGRVVDVDFVPVIDPSAGRVAVQSSIQTTLNSLEDGPVTGYIVVLVPIEPDEEAVGRVRWRVQEWLDKGSPRIPVRLLVADEKMFEGQFLALLRELGRG